MSEPEAFKHLIQIFEFGEIIKLRAQIRRLEAERPVDLELLRRIQSDLGIAFDNLHGVVLASAEFYERKGEE